MPASSLPQDADETEVLADEAEEEGDAEEEVRDAVSVESAWRDALIRRPLLSSL